MILVIDTIINDRILLGLVDRDKLIKKQGTVVGFKQAEKLLILIDQLLKKSKIKITGLTGIIVASGPGGFTAVRLGILTANILSYSLQIPAVGLPITKFNSLEELVSRGVKELKKKKGFSLLQPFYGTAPKITKSKKNYDGKNIRA